MRSLKTLTEVVDRLKEIEEENRPSSPPSPPGSDCDSPSRGMDAYFVEIGAEDVANDILEVVRALGRIVG